MLSEEIWGLKEHMFQKFFSFQQENSVQRFITILVTFALDFELHLPAIVSLVSNFLAQLSLEQKFWKN